MDRLFAVDETIKDRTRSGYPDAASQCHHGNRLLICHCRLHATTYFHDEEVDEHSCCNLGG